MIEPTITISLQEYQNLLESKKVLDSYSNDKSNAVVRYNLQQWMGKIELEYTFVTESDIIGLLAACAEHIRQEKDKSISELLNEKRELEKKIEWLKLSKFRRFLKSIS